MAGKRTLLAVGELRLDDDRAPNDDFRLAHAIAAALFTEFFETESARTIPKVAREWELLVSGAKPVAFFVAPLDKRWSIVIHASLDRREPFNEDELRPATHEYQKRIGEAVRRIEWVSGITWLSFFPSSGELLILPPE
jgi:hypothetical protein